MFKSSKICSFGSTINNLRSYHLGAYIGWWNFLMGVLTMNGTDLFGHFNLELDEINPRTFLDTFRNLLKHFLSNGQGPSLCIKCGLRIIKLKSCHPGAIFWPECGYLPIKTDTCLNYFRAIKKNCLDDLWLVKHLSKTDVYWSRGVELKQFWVIQKGRQN